jgi:hypothetical protein
MNLEDHQPWRVKQSRKALRAYWGDSSGQAQRQTYEITRTNTVNDWKQVTPQSICLTGANIKRGLAIGHLSTNKRQPAWEPTRVSFPGWSPTGPTGSVGDRGRRGPSPGSILRSGLPAVASREVPSRSPLGSSRPSCLSSCVVGLQRFPCFSYYFVTTLSSIAVNFEKDGVMDRVSHIVSSHVTVSATSLPWVTVTGCHININFNTCLLKS